MITGVLGVAESRALSMAIFCLTISTLRSGIVIPMGIRCTIGEVGACCLIASCSRWRCLVFFQLLVEAFLFREFCRGICRSPSSSSTGVSVTCIPFCDTTDKAQFFPARACLAGTALTVTASDFMGIFGGKKLVTMFNPGLSLFEDLSRRLYFALLLYLSRWKALCPLVLPSSVSFRDDIERLGDSKGFVFRYGCSWCPPERSIPPSNCW